MIAHSRLRLLFWVSMEFALVVTTISKILRLACQPPAWLQLTSGASTSHGRSFSHWIDNQHNSGVNDDDDGWRYVFVVFSVAKRVADVSSQSQIDDILATDYLLATQSTVRPTHHTPFAVKAIIH